MAMGFLQVRRQFGLRGNRQRGWQAPRDLTRKTGP